MIKRNKRSIHAERVIHCNDHVSHNWNQDVKCKHSPTLNTDLPLLYCLNWKTVFMTTFQMSCTFSLLLVCHYPLWFGKGINFGVQAFTQFSVCIIELRIGATPWWNMVFHAVCCKSLLDWPISTIYKEQNFLRNAVCDPFRHFHRGPAPLFGCLLQMWTYLWHLPFCPWPFRNPSLRLLWVRAGRQCG